MKMRYIISGVVLLILGLLTIYLLRPDKPAGQQSNNTEPGKNQVKSGNTGSANTGGGNNPNDGNQRDRGNRGGNRGNFGGGPGGFGPGSGFGGGGPGFGQGGFGQRDPLTEIISALTELVLTPEFTLTKEQRDAIASIKAARKDSVDKWQAEHADALKKIDEAFREAGQSGGFDKFRELGEERQEIMATMPKSDDAAKQVRQLLNAEQVSQLDSFLTTREAEMEKMREEMRQRFQAGGGGGGFGNGGGGGGGGNRGGGFGRGNRNGGDSANSNAANRIGSEGGSNNKPSEKQAGNNPLSATLSTM